jgi:diacylglycerol kinase (ATP)
MNHKKFLIRDRLKSFKVAFNGIKLLFLNEQNVWIHLLATLCVIIAGFVLKISKSEWIAIIIAIGFVMTLEAINSSIEKLSDFVSPEKQDQIKKVKDLAAAGVLISSITALLIGSIVFIPRIIEMIKTS